MTLMLSGFFLHPLSLCSGLDLWALQSIPVAVALLCSDTVASLFSSDIFPGIGTGMHFFLLARLWL